MGNPFFWFELSKTFFKITRVSILLGTRIYLWDGGGEEGYLSGIIPVYKVLGYTNGLTIIFIGLVKTLGLEKGPGFLKSVVTILLTRLNSNSS